MFDFRQSKLYRKKRRLLFQKHSNLEQNLALIADCICRKAYIHSNESDAWCLPSFYSISPIEQGYFPIEWLKV